MASKAVELARECQREAESCLYTATTFYIWVRCLRWTRGFLIVLGLAAGSVASMQILRDSEKSKVWVAIISFIAGLIPTAMAALKLDSSLAAFSASAADFKNLQDRFRQAAIVWSQKPFAEFEAEFRRLMDCMDKVRKQTIPAPEWCFRHAQRKIKSGDYNFDVDIAAIEKAEAKG